MDLRELLSRHGVAYKTEHRSLRSGWIGIETCPFCKHVDCYFAIQPEQMRCSCWACGWHKLTDALAALTGEHWSAFKGVFDGTAVHHKRQRPTGRFRPPAGLARLLPEHVQYLRGRDMDPDRLSALYGIAGIGWRGRFAWRIYLPVPHRGLDGSWTTRAIGDHDGPRYLSAAPEEEALPLKSLLFGFDLARHAVIVTEGPFDALRIGPGAVATMGVSYTQEQVALIASFPLRYICFDNEPVPQQRAIALCQELEVFAGKTQRLQIDAKDPGAASPKEIKLLRGLLE